MEVRWEKFEVQYTDHDIASGRDRKDINTAKRIVNDENQKKIRFSNQSQPKGQKSSLPMPPLFKSPRVEYINSLTLIFHLGENWARIVFSTTTASHLPGDLYNSEPSLRGKQRPNPTLLPSAKVEEGPVPRSGGLPGVDLTPGSSGNRKKDKE